MVHKLKLVSFFVFASPDADNRMRPDIPVIDEEHISLAELLEHEVVILPEFVTSMENYVQILTSMARHSVRGILHSFLTKQDAAHVGELIEILGKFGHSISKRLMPYITHAGIMEFCWKCYLL